MDWPQPRPEAVETALTWLREQDPRLSPEALAARLRSQGYTESEVSEAIRVRRSELEAGVPPARDLRRPATAVLVTTFLATWGVITLGLLARPSSSGLYGLEGVAALILGALLLPMLVVGLALIRNNRRLQRGVMGAMALVLAVPFIYLVVVAGVCVATTNPWS
jgi:hypothetical protein